MRVIYDKEADVLRIIGEQPVADTASLLRGPDAAVDTATFGGYDVIGLIVIGASAYLPLGRGYDADRDILTIGETTDDPALVTENGDFVGYWEVCELGPDGLRDPIGVALRDASKHLAPVITSLTG
jgi:uncharacterized protein YuzE